MSRGSLAARVAAFMLGPVLGGVLAVTMCGQPPAPAANPALRDSLAVARLEIARLEDARARADQRATADSLALADIRRRVRVVPRPDPAGVDTLTDTLIVYEVPAPVAALVHRLEARVVTLEAVLDTTRLALVATARAGELADAIAEQTLDTLNAERKRRRGDMLKAGGVGSLLGALAILIIVL